MKSEVTAESVCMIVSPSREACTSGGRRAAHRGVYTKRPDGVCGPVLGYGERSPPACRFCSKLAAGRISRGGGSGGSSAAASNADGSVALDGSDAAPPSAGALAP